MSGLSKGVGQQQLQQPQQPVSGDRGMVKQDTQVSSSEGMAEEEPPPQPSSQMMTMMMVSSAGPLNLSKPRNPEDNNNHVDKLDRMLLLSKQGGPPALPDGDPDAAGASGGSSHQLAPTLDEALEMLRKTTKTLFGGGNTFGSQPPLPAPQPPPGGPPPGPGSSNLFGPGTSSSSSAFQQALARGQQLPDVVSTLPMFSAMSAAASAMFSASGENEATSSGHQNLANFYAAAGAPTTTTAPNCDPMRFGPGGPFDYTALFRGYQHHHHHQRHPGQPAKSQALLALPHAAGGVGGGGGPQGPGGPSNHMFPPGFGNQLAAAMAAAAAAAAASASASASASTVAASAKDGAAAGNAGLRVSGSRHVLNHGGNNVGNNSHHHHHHRNINPHHHRYHRHINLSSPSSGASPKPGGGRPQGSGLDESPPPGETGDRD